MTLKALICALTSNAPCSIDKLILPKRMEKKTRQYPRKSMPFIVYIGRDRVNALCKDQSKSVRTTFFLLIIFALLFDMYFFFFFMLYIVLVIISQTELCVSVFISFALVYFFISHLNDILIFDVCCQNDSFVLAIFF